MILIAIEEEEVCKATSNVVLCRYRGCSKHKEKQLYHHQWQYMYQQRRRRRRQEYVQQYQILQVPVVVVNHIFITVLFVLYVQVQSNHAFTFHSTTSTNTGSKTKPTVTTTVSTTTTTTTTTTTINRNCSRQFPKFTFVLSSSSSSTGSQEMTTITTKKEFGTTEPVPLIKNTSTKNSLKPNQYNKRQNDETQQQQQQKDLLQFLNNDIIRSLDFDQIITIIAYYTTTKRGQQGLLSLVQLDEISLEQQQVLNNNQQKQQSIKNFLYNQNKKSINQRSTTGSSSRSTILNDDESSSASIITYENNDNIDNDNNIDESLFIPSRQKFTISSKIASNQQDVNELYNCVEQAMLVYTSSTTTGSISTTNNDNTIHIPLPPFLSTQSSSLPNLSNNDNNDNNNDSTTYKFTIPTLTELNNNNNNLDDYDTFLQLRPKVWTYENIIHCEQMIQYIISFYKWSINDNVQLFVPDLSNHIQNVISIQNYNTILSLYDTIKDSIQIIRVRTIQDPTGSYTYKLQLNDSKFTILRLLRQQRIQIELSLNNKENKNKLQTVDKLRAELYDINIKIESKENEISKSIIKLLYNHIVLIDTCFNCSCELDVIFAKAKFAIAFNGQIPKQQKQSLTQSQYQKHHQGNNGQINVPNFIHPLLLVSQQQKRLVSNNVNDIVPIDLLLSVPKIHNDTKQVVEHALIISGSNGGGKTLALKSFGLVVLMTRLGIPIPVAQQSKKYTLVQQQQNQQSITNSNNNNNKIIIDYFDHVFASIGDQQNINNGESTYTSQLKKYSTIINIVNNYNDNIKKPASSSYSIDNDDNQTDETTENGASILVLLDELGSGTESTIGSAIGQGVIESLLQNNNNNNSNNNSCRIVATTHSNSLKVLAFNNDSFNCASVLLENTIVDNDNDLINDDNDIGNDYDNCSKNEEKDDDEDYESDDYDDDDDVYNDYQDLSIQQQKQQIKKPEYKLHYGSIGDSYGLDAAIRCNPPFPSSMLQRVTELTSSTSISISLINPSTSSSSVLTMESGTSTNDIDTSWQYQLALTRSIEQNAKEMKYAKEQAEIMAEQIQLLRSTMLQLATSYEEHFTLLEKRVDNCFQVLKKQQSNGGQGTTAITKEVLGSTINEIRLVQKHIKSEKELLKEKGLKFLPNSYSLSEGEKVFIVASHLPSSILTELVTTTTIDAVDSSSSFVNIHNVDDDELCIAARVVSNHFLPLNERALLRPDDVVVSPESTITNGISSNTIPDGTRTFSNNIPTTGKRIVVKRSSLAIWDYDSVWDVENSKLGIGITGSSVNKLDDIGDVRSVKRKVNDVLAMLKAVETDKPKLGKKPATSSFTSSRGRRADKAKQSTTKKKKK